MIEFETDLIKTLKNIEADLKNISQNTMIFNTMFAV